jgi:hypothetical protein
MDPLESDAQSIAKTALESKVSIAIIGHSWDFVTEHMGRLVRDILKDSLIHYSRMHGYMRLKNGTEILMLSSQASRDFHRLHGKDIDVVWVQGRISRELAELLHMRMSQGRLDNILYSE